MYKSKYFLTLKMSIWSQTFQVSLLYAFDSILFSGNNHNENTFYLQLISKDLCNKSNTPVSPTTTRKDSPSEVTYPSTNIQVFDQPLQTSNLKDTRISLLLSLILVLLRNLPKLISRKLLQPRLSEAIQWPRIFKGLN